MLEPQLYAQPRTYGGTIGRAAGPGGCVPAGRREELAPTAGYGVPGVCVFYVAQQWNRRVTAIGELDYALFTDVARNGLMLCGLFGLLALVFDLPGIFLALVLDCLSVTLSLLCHAHTDSSLP